MLTLVYVLREMFGVQLYKNNARELLLRILSILNLDWLQHARSVRGVYELGTTHSSISGPSNLQPKGHMRPTRQYCAAPLKSYIFS